MSLTRITLPANHAIILIDDKNIETYINLARSYEAEFSNLTHKLPNESGIFEPDTMPTPPYKGYLLYKYKTPIGFCIAEINDEINDVAEFYIVPSARKNKLGQILATTLFDMHPGEWQVRQIAGADGAKSFWRKVISEHTQNQYSEAVVSDPDWGIVTRQRFMIYPMKKSAINTSETKDKPQVIQIRKPRISHRHIAKSPLE